MRTWNARRAWPLWALVGLVVVLAGACKRASGEGAQAPRLQLTPCRLEDVSAEARCGTLEVWEDRAAKAGRRIKLEVAVLPALAAQPEPDPIVLLAGGPGQAATKVAGRALGAIERIRARRDVLLVDQRGTGGSNELECESDSPDAGLADRYSEGFETAELEACAKKLDADLTKYTTPIAMDDLDEVREALGYDQLNLWGVSYGTRAALVYLRQHPEHVRTAILDGVAPMQFLLPLYMPRDSGRALDLMFRHCEADAACKAAYPELRAHFAELLARLKAAPADARVAHPRTGVVQPVRIPFTPFTSYLRGYLYLPEATSVVPLTLERAWAGDFTPFVAGTASLTEGFSGGMSMGMFFSVVCSEDAPFTTPEMVERETRGTWAGDAMVKNLLAVCEKWPRGSVPAGYRDPVRSDAPVLLLSGELDPVTPPSWAELASKTLPHSLHVTVPGVGHGAYAHACARNLMRDFVERGSVEGLTPDCASAGARPPFFTSFAGPTP